MMDECREVYNYYMSSVFIAVCLSSVWLARYQEIYNLESGPFNAPKVSRLDQKLHRAATIDISGLGPVSVSCVPHNAECFISLVIVNFSPPEQKVDGGG